MPCSPSRVSIAFLLALFFSNSQAFTSRPAFASPATSTAQPSRLSWGTASTVEELTRERTARKTGGGGRRSDRYTNDEDDELEEDDIDYPDLEYLEDMQVSRELEDPFHILLLGSTFDKPKVTVSYVSGSLEYVLNMPRDEANELAKFAKEEGMSCLGTWTREECLSLGKQLQVRDMVCRVVPYTEGGQRGWQAAKDAASNSLSNIGASQPGYGAQQQQS